ncbi:hypothetical protein RQM59_03735 [Flavobacteriaceae bacterium S356]|uniref:Gram-positive cocci surface proteins LPxTG domain-containing protein n=1 Tax=Asprobacillus argus TaxID=3076534 RepID=A0ABU3LCM2_9FLAO|nr:hypothetical protein [Flavobacteriaceae bacterium S356]
MLLQIMPTDTIQEATASSTLFFSVVLVIFILGAIAFFFASKKVKK